jgi:hypothetical protein
MISRRELVTGGAIGALAVTPLHADEAAAPLTQGESGQSEGMQTSLLRKISDQMEGLNNNVTGLGSAFKTNSVGYGYIPKLREAFTLFWKTTGKFPEFVEVGTDVFYDIYDWHIKHKLNVPVSRAGDGRMTITFMYTQLLVRIEQSGSYIGIPFDRPG